MAIELPAEAIRAFVQRDWARVERAKVAYWAELGERSGNATAVAVAEALREHVERHAAPTPEDRAPDLAHHVLLKRKLDAARGRFGQ